MTDVGQKIFCRVTATNASGSAQAFSNVVGPVVAGAPVGGSTWDPANKTTYVELDGTNLTATVDDSGVFAIGEIRATTSRSTGKYYFEHTINTNGSLIAVDMVGTIGIGSSSHTIGSGIPGKNDSFGAYLRLHLANVAMIAQTEGVVNNYNSPVVTAEDGAIFGFACDIDAHLISCYKNGALLTGGAGTSLDWGSSAGAAMFPYFCAQYQGIAGKFLSATLNTAGPFALATLPSGYAAWG